ncbi:hypothetical protein [Candidatus Enterococcus ferrettii]|uniref:hypothetical protein n=1 Tax=Candidatus Enterococcus ferrettii TaxID=2815324 RepID=UPI001F621EC0|nr:hypothetical protein [Enterococcus sp. 665A]
MIHTVGPIYRDGNHGEEAARILYEVASRKENEDLQVNIVVIRESWLTIFEKLKE